MKINLAKHRGFCFGVKRAIDIALNTLEKNKDVYILGDIVHNENVMKELRKAGIKKIKRLARGKNKTFLIRAHGACKNSIKQAMRLGYNIVDTTCPMVKEIHRIASDMEKKKYKIIIIGDKKHDEVHGIIGQLKNKPLVIDGLKNILFKKTRKINKACVIVQSTQNLEKVLAIVRVLKQYVKKLVFFNTICKPTRLKQAEIKRMPLENDLMLIIGSKASANTKRLYEISKSLNQKSFWINSKKEIRRGWFKGVKKVGITAGASTPDITTQEIISQVRKITRSKSYR
ncbi:MAG: 4-hydroxy-3-methylbut-2-enyl diphosphate reductase [Candidatus Omnitrophota bacterium]|nr:MAG: 4-hydroxy-3-methylbut-2-enyl diphosphate reductase [Candidatus Omnitrophota bacterium]